MGPRPTTLSPCPASWPPNRPRSTIRRPPHEARGPRGGVRFVRFMVEPNAEQLRQIGASLDAGQVRPTVSQVFPFAEARRAFEEGEKGHARGKIVLTVS